jgi:predicted methyltransferase
MKTRSTLLIALAATALAGAAFAQMSGPPPGGMGGPPGGPMAGPPGPPPAPPAPITAARPQADLDRDANRKPTQTIAFAGIKPGMKVAELAPGGGYYTRMLSAAVGPTGKVYAVASPGQAARPNGLFTLNGLAAVLPNVQVVVSDNATLTLPEPVDVVWTTENYHDFHNGPTANIAGVNKAVFAALKPGGVFFVEDHAAADGAGLEATSKVHRMDEAVAKTELTAAGFKLDGESNILRNPADNKAASNAEAGHFASDRFMLRMKKP